MAVGRLARLASEVPVPVYLAVGAGARAATDAVRADPRIDVVDSPRHATVLLIAGAIPASFVHPLGRVHDQVSHPRATVWWTGPGDITAAGLPAAERLCPDDDVAARLTEVHRALLAGERDSEPDLLPDEPPNPWEGLGSNGQGGEGMMGGVPYGRPMAMTADDRDGLALDTLSFSLGPFLPWMPPGLELQVTMQGDVLTDVEAGPNPFTGGVPLGGPLHAPHPGDAVSEARERLQYVARVLDVHGLRALAVRTFGLATEASPGDSARIDRLSRRLRRTMALRWSTEGFGTVSESLVGDPWWNGDASDRWRRALDDARRLVVGEQVARWAATNGTGDRATVAVLPGLLQGMELGQAVTTIVSLDPVRELPAGARVAL